RGLSPVGVSFSCVALAEAADAVSARRPTPATRTVSVYQCLRISVTWTLITSANFAPCGYQCQSTSYCHPVARCLHLAGRTVPLNGGPRLSFAKSSTASLKL